jgi:hypothetical protein
MTHCAKGSPDKSSTLEVITSHHNLSGFLVCDTAAHVIKLASEKQNLRQQPPDFSLAQANEARKQFLRMCADSVRYRKPGR